MLSIKLQDANNSVVLPFFLLLTYMNTVYTLSGKCFISKFITTVYTAVFLACDLSLLGKDETDCHSVAALY